MISNGLKQMLAKYIHGKVEKIHNLHRKVRPQDQTLNANRCLPLMWDGSPLYQNR